MTHRRFRHRAPRPPRAARIGVRPVQCAPTAAALYLPSALARRQRAPMIDPLPFVTYTFVMSITPGPNNVMLTASGASFGFRRTLPHMLGIACGFVVQLLALCAGLAALFAQWPQLQSVLGWVGAAYLLFLGWRMLSRHDTAARLGAHPVTFIQAALF